MDEYIRREDVIEWFMPYAHAGESIDADVVISDIKGMKAANVAPVVLGRWDDSGRYTFPSGDVAVRCTNCGCALTKSEYRLYTWNYCPICGAKMDGGDSDEKSV